MLITVILIGLCLIASIVFNVLLYKAGERQLVKTEIYEQWISEFKRDVLKTYNTIKDIDNKQIFEKDDEVGVIFQEMVDLITVLNQRTQEEEGE